MADPPTTPASLMRGLWNAEDAAVLLRDAAQLLRDGSVPPEAIAAAVADCLELARQRVLEERRLPPVELGDLSRAIWEGRNRG